MAHRGATAHAWQPVEVRVAVRRVEPRAYAGIRRERPHGHGGHGVSYLVVRRGGTERRGTYLG